MIVFKGFSLLAAVGFLAFAIVGRERGGDGRPTYCGHVVDTPYLRDLSCDAVDVTVYVVTFAVVIALLAWLVSNIARRD